MDDIADDVELSKATLYLYFKNKASLYFAVVIKGIVILRDTFKNAVKNEATGLGKIISIIRAFFDYNQIHSDYYRLNRSVRDARFAKMLQSTKDDDTEIENAEKYNGLIKELLGIITDAVILGIRDGTIRKDLNPIQTVMFLGSAIEASIQIPPEFQLLLEIYGMTAEGYLQHSIDVILQGISRKNKLEGDKKI